LFFIFYYLLIWFICLLFVLIKLNNNSNKLLKLLFIGWKLSQFFYLKIFMALIKSISQLQTMKATLLELLLSLPNCMPYSAILSYPHPLIFLHLEINESISLLSIQTLIYPNIWPIVKKSNHMYKGPNILHSVKQVKY